MQVTERIAESRAIERNAQHPRTGPSVWIDPTGYHDMTRCARCAARAQKDFERYRSGDTYDPLGTETIRELPKGHPFRQCGDCDYRESSE